MGNRVNYTVRTGGVKDMYKVLIIDDQIFICRGLAEIIDWKNEGFETVEYTTRPDKVLEMFDVSVPDLIITDVCMPQTDGFNLLNNIHSQYPKLLNIVISGYNEFEYARKAIRSYSLDYLLKPISEEELLAAVRKAKQTLDRRIAYPVLSEADMDAFQLALLNADEEAGMMILKTKESQILQEGLPQVCRYNTLKKLIDIMIKFSKEMNLPIFHDYCDIEEINFLDVYNIYNHLFECMKKEKLSAGTRIVNELCRKIEEQYSSNLTVQKMAEEMFVTPAYLGQVFKKKLDMSFNDYLHMVRINKAKELLQSDVLSIAQISEKTGYKTIDHFYRKFKEIMGVTPKEFRESAKNP